MADLGYQVLCVSLYDADVEALKESVSKLKGFGWSKANRSHLIRIALARLDDDALRAIADEQKALR